LLIDTPVGWIIVGINRVVPDVLVRPLPELAMTWIAGILVSPLLESPKKVLNI
jgi:hypothetical protein